MEKNYMSKQEKYLMKAKDNCERAIEIMRAKSSDYAQINDPYANFRGSEYLGVNLKRGILIRIMDKISRINNLIDREAVVEESVENDCLDVMNYINIVLMKFQEEHKLTVSERFEAECKRGIGGIIGEDIIGEKIKEKKYKHF